MPGDEQEGKEEQLETAPSKEETVVGEVPGVTEHMRNMFSQESLEAIAKKIAPVRVSSVEELAKELKIGVVKCPDCGAIWTRTAGQITAQVPVLEGSESRAPSYGITVQICTECKCRFVMNRGTPIIVTEVTDLDAWADLEAEIAPKGRCSQAGLGQPAGEGDPPAEDGG